MTELEIKIKEAANAYYKDGSSPYTDEEFDEMMEELRETQPDSELLKNGVQEELKGVSKKYKLEHHGLYKSRLYWVWHSMKDRCYNPKATSYKHYGGRGIKVCDEWKNSFKTFYDWSYSHGYDENAPRNKCTIDRINNDGDYEPSNCRLVDAKIQASNQRKRSIKK